MEAHLEGPGGSALSQGGSESSRTKGPDPHPLARLLPCILAERLRCQEVKHFTNGMQH